MNELSAQKTDGMPFVVFITWGNFEKTSVQIFAALFLFHVFDVFVVQ